MSGPEGLTDVSFIPMGERQRFRYTRDVICPLLQQIVTVDLRMEMEEFVKLL